MPSSDTKKKENKEEKAKEKLKSERKSVFVYLIVLLKCYFFIWGGGWAKNLSTEVVPPPSLNISLNPKKGY